MRDSQRKKLYDAEHDLWRASPRVESIEDIKAFVVAALIKNPSPVARIVQSKILNGHFHFGDGRGSRRGRANRNEIHMPKGVRHQLYLLHELAHVLVHNDAQYGWGSTVASHGPEFAGVYLDLVNRVMGFNWWMPLRNQFIARRVKFNEQHMAKAA